MENKKPLSADQLNALKETVRQRFDELYHRIGSNRQNLMNKVLFVHHQINKELAKEMIDSDHEKEILLKVRETERSADKQLPLVRKVPQAVSSAAPAPAKAVTPVKESKQKESKPKAEKPKETKAKESKPKAKESKAKTSKAKPAKKKKK